MASRMLSLQFVSSQWRSRLIELGLCLSMLLFFFWPHPPASLLLLVAVAIFAYLRLEIAVALLPLTFPYYLFLEPLRSSGRPAFSIGELSLCICLGVALLRSALLPTDRSATREWARGLWHQARSVLLPALLLLIGASLAVLVSPDRHESLRAYRQEIIEPFLYFLLILRYLQTRLDLVRTITALVVSAVIVACTGIIQGFFYLTPYLLVVDATTFRIAGPYGSANNMAFLLERVLPILLALAFLSPFRRSGVPRWPGQARWRDPLRWLCVIAMIPLFWALYWTGSRGAEAAMVVVLVLVAIFELRFWLVGLLVVALGALAVKLSWSHILNLANQQGHGLFAERLLLWKAGLLIIRDHFLLGTGPDSFNAQYNPAAPTSYALKALNGQPFPTNFTPVLSHPHDLLLDFWISTGLLGLAALIWLLKAFSTLLIRVYLLYGRLQSGDTLQRLVLGIAGSMIAAVMHGLVDNFYFVPDLAMIFWLFFGILFVLQRIAEREQSPQDGIADKQHLTAASIG